MAARFPSQLHQRDARADLFKNFSPSPSSRSPGPGGATPRASGYGYGGYGGQPASSSASASTYTSRASPSPGAGGGGSYRPATPNSRGQYSQAVLNELESQNEDQVEGILGKVKILKDMSLAIGDEIRDSSALAEKMNDQFDRTRVRLRGTMNRMLLMAERTGVPWRVWLLFFAAVVLLFLYVKWT
jgi:blocked-early-in-transport protein 1